MKRIYIMLAFVVLLSTQSLAKATVGPVKLDFGYWYKSIGASRANAANNFVVNFVYIKKVKFYDWVKVWLPLNESVPCKTKEELVKNSCNGLPEITGGLESPRFVPNKAYFEKYPNSPEKDIGKLYRASGEKYYEVSFMDPEYENSFSFDDCNFDSSSPKLVKDPSGLGYWTLGTVLPALPRDEAKRIEFLINKRYYINIGFPCACLTFNYHLNVNCKERSISVNNPFELEPWRKGYNVADVNVTKDMGIVFPATPGRYRVAVATLPEPVPVESESFILPCSDVSDVECNATEFGFSSRNPFTVSFRTGEGGALDKKLSTISIRLPKSFLLPQKLSKRQIKVNDVELESEPEISTLDAHTIVKLATPVDLNNFTNVKVAFDNSSKIVFMPWQNDSFVEVATSSEPSFIKSPVLSKLTESIAVIQPTDEFRESSISLRLLLDDNKTYPKFSLIKVVLPEAFTINAKITHNDITVNGIQPLTEPIVKGRTVELSAPEAIEKQLVLGFLLSCGIKNPGTGFYFLKLEIGKDSYVFDQTYIQPAKARIVNLKLSSVKPKSFSNLTFDFQPSSFGDIEVGDKIEIQFPLSFVLPDSLDGRLITIDKVKVDKAKVIGSKIILDSPVRQTVTGRHQYLLSIAMKLPDVLSGNENLLFSTSNGDIIETSFGFEEAYGQDGN